MPGHPAAATPKGQERPDTSDQRLRTAVVRLEMTSPRTATVQARYTFAGNGPVSLLLARFPGQQLQGLEASVGSTRVDMTLRPSSGGAVQRIAVSDVQAGAEVSVWYRVSLSPNFAFRYPVPVPEPAPDATGSSVQVEALLPRGASYSGDGFPAFVAAGRERDRALLRARLVGVPAFVHVVFGQRDHWPANRRIELAALLVMLVPGAVGLGLWWRRRRTVRNR